MQFRDTRRVEPLLISDYVSLVSRTPARAPASPAIADVSSARAPAVRAVELKQLEEAYAQLGPATGRQLVLLEGDAGVGKSRVVAEFKSRVRLSGGVVLEGRAEPNTPYAPFAEIVAKAVDFLAEVGAADAVTDDLSCASGCHRFWFQHTSQKGAQEANGNLREKRARLFDGVSRILEAVSAVRPPVLIVHDLERADRATVELLEYLLEADDLLREDGRIPSALFLATLRPGPQRVSLEHVRELASVGRLQLGALDADGVRAYLQSPEVIARIMARTGGNPEAIDLLLQAEIQAPEARIEQLVRRLSPAAKRLLDGLAVRSVPASAEELAAVVGQAPSADAIKELIASELVTKQAIDGRVWLSFCRPADLERVAGTLGEASAQLHSAWARVMESQEQWPEAAHHASLARNGADAARYALLATSMLCARHAHDEAARLLEQALLLSQVRQTELALRAQLCDLYRSTGDNRRALEEASRLVAANDSTEHRLRLAELLRLTGNLAEAERVLTDLRAACPTRAVFAELAELAYVKGNPEEAAHFAESAIEAASEDGTQDLPTLLRARNTLGKVMLDRGALDEAVEHFEHNRREATERAVKTFETQALGNLGLVAWRRGQYVEAEKLFLAAEDCAEATADGRGLAFAASYLAALLHARRDYIGSLHHYRRSASIHRRLGSGHSVARLMLAMALLYAELGESARARDLLAFVDRQSQDDLPGAVCAEASLVRGVLALNEGELELAERLLGRSFHMFSATGGSPARAGLSLARALLEQGKLLDAGAALCDVAAVKDRGSDVALDYEFLQLDLDRGNGVHNRTGRAREIVEQADRLGDSERLLRALTILAQSELDESEAVAAERIIVRAEQLMLKILARVPEESVESWKQSGPRAALTALANICRSRSSWPPPRAASNLVVTALAQRNEWNTRYPEIIGVSAPIEAIFRVLDKVAQSDALVLVRGESGSGKELVADALHRNSPRRSKPLVKVNCAALVETLLLSELFGHEKGSFTGAQARKKGRFELAEGGTLFLDEIGDISPKTQVALLRVLQEREFERVGGTQTIKANVRIVAATHRDLEQMVKDGLFREDLYYRLRGVSIKMPALRERISDLPLVATRLLERIADERGESVKRLSQEATELLSQHAWPGNVRELENVLRSASLFSDGSVMNPEDFESFSQTFIRPERADDSTQVALNATVDDLVYQKVRGGAVSLFDMKKDLERHCIVQALQESQGNITKAAAVLGMKRPRLSQLVKEYGLNGTSDE